MSTFQTKVYDAYYASKYNLGQTYRKVKSFGAEALEFFMGAAALVGAICFLLAVFIFMGMMLYRLTPGGVATQADATAKEASRQIKLKANCREAGGFATLDKEGDYSGCVPPK